MLNRRHLRVKVLQTLYAYHLSENKDVKDFEKKLLKSVDSVNEMYIWTLALLDEVSDYVLVDADERKNKYLPTEQDLEADTKLSTNTFIESLRANADYRDAVKRYRVSWSFDPEIVRSIFAQLRSTDEYASYVASTDRSIASEKDIIKFVFKRLILKIPAIEQAFEEKFLNWPVDKEVLQALVAKTFKNFSSENPAQNKLADLTPDWPEDRIFILDLFAHTVRHREAHQKLIADKTKNWDAERIALLDTILMQMALTELMHFPSIPVKVTINEYIDISKVYSTAKSSTFINGVLDKILGELQAAGRIFKQGRGLVER